MENDMKIEVNYLSTFLVHLSKTHSGYQWKFVTYNAKT